MGITFQDVLEEIKENIDKSDFMLNKIMSEYCFYKSPSYEDLRIMVHDWEAKSPVQSEEVKQAEKWALGYNDVFTSITIAFDYVLEMKQLLQDLIKKAGENN